MKEFYESLCGRVIADKSFADQVLGLLFGKDHADLHLHNFHEVVLHLVGIFWSLFDLLPIFWVLRLWIHYPVVDVVVGHQSVLERAHQLANCVAVVCLFLEFVTAGVLKNDVLQCVQDGFSIQMQQNSLRVFLDLDELVAKVEEARQPGDTLLTTVAASLTLLVEGLDVLS